MVKRVFILLILILAFPLHAMQELCPGVKIYDKEINLDDTERRLVCGDKKQKAYSKIPAYEARFFFQGFLQSRGYLNPEFTISEETLHVHPGDRSEIERISVRSENKNLSEEVDSELERLFADETLNTPTLNQMESFSESLMREKGFPCSKISSEALIDKDHVIISLEEMNKFDFGKVKREEIEGLRPNALDRYYPFKSNESFDHRLLELTEKRMLRSEVVQGTYFLEDCSENEFSLSQNFILGPPRTIRFGVGASTEVGPMARVKWSHNRYKSMASVLSATLQASFRSQSLTLSADSFLWHEKPRRSLYSQLELLRESQLEYEQVVFRIKPHMKWTRDSEGFHKLYTLGPTYENGYYRSTEESQTKHFSTGIIEGGLVWTEHEYEFFDLHPQSGEVMNLNFDFRHPGMGFTDELLKLNSSFLKLGRLATSGRGTLVGGARLNLGTTWVDQKVPLSDLPPTVKFFGGGSDDARGFQLRTLPDNQGLGALTKVGLKLELRRTYLFKESIEAFTFFDSAYFGARSWMIDPPFFYSPGVGMRWLSPIGVVQGFVSRGFRERPYKDFGNLYYIGIGGVF